MDKEKKIKTKVIDKVLTIIESPKKAKMIINHLMKHENEFFESSVDIINHLDDILEEGNFSKHQLQIISVLLLKYYYVGLLIQKESYYNNINKSYIDEIVGNKFEIIENSNSNSVNIILDNRKIHINLN